MANQANIKAVITAEDKASSVLSKFGDNTNKLAGTLASVFAGASIIAFGKQSVKAFEESETALAQLDAVLKSTGGSAGITKNQVIKLSKEIQKTTSVSDESALAVENMALTFTNIGKDSFPDFTKAAIDVATAMNHGVTPNTEQLVDVTKQLGKALQDPDGSIGALHRMGINTDELKEKIKDIHDPIEKQRAILKELSTEMGGSATEHAKTLGGQMEQLKNQFNDTQEKIGETLLKSLKPFMDFISEHPTTIPILTDSLLALAGAFVLVKSVAVISGVMSIAATAISGLGTAATVTGGALSAMAGIAAIPIAVVVAGAIADLYLLKKAADSVKGAFEAVNNSASAAANLAPEGQIRTLQKQAAAARALGDTVQVTRIANAIAALGGGRASGGPITAGVPYLVGEKGPEIVVPGQSGTVIPNNKIGGTINININAGALMGSDTEARKFASLIWKHIQDASSMRNQTMGSY